jgi:hypothetical protein
LNPNVRPKYFLFSFFWHKSPSLRFILLSLISIHFLSHSFVHSLTHLLICVWNRNVDLVLFVEPHDNRNCIVVKRFWSVSLKPKPN